MLLTTDTQEEPALRSLRTIKAKSDVKGL